MNSGDVGPPFGSRKKPRQAPSAVRKTIHRSSKGVQHGKVQICRGRIFAHDNMLPRGNPAAPTSGKHDKQAMWIMLIAVAQRRSEHDHRVVQNGPLSFLHVPELPQKIAILLHVPAIDDGVLPEFFRVLRVMRDLVMRVCNTLEKTEIDSANGIAEHERSNARGVALESNCDQIQHESNMLFMGG